nr:immunoglobulin light chain junction region [Macaca mulatta]MOX87090.1 immunoglobulin light chain junction region [Macaca mulatta]MOX88227.1 immunoglobulin light chain junction region [Macaca mulatta]MOX88825.1 immunoglobulin light chain junction region [Macaca mulatta]
CQHGYGPPFTF